MNRSILILLAGLLTAACNNNSKSALGDSHTAKNDSTKEVQNKLLSNNLIIPGESIGQTSINEDAATMVKRLGKPDAGDAAMGKALSIWYAGHDTTAHQTAIFSSRQMGTADEASRIKQIRVTSPEFVTKNGIHVGSDLKQIGQYFELKKVAHYAKGETNYDISESKEGIAFETDPSGKCVAIMVYPKGERQIDTYLPFYNNLYWY
jgi:hypothetical protein